MAASINRVILVGNLTKDPELRATPSGTSVCKLRLAVNTRRKNGAGEWVDKPNYFDVVVWGNHGENCATYLQKGKPIAVDGRLEWREWTATDGSGKRQAVEIVADTVQFLRGRDDDATGGGGDPPAESSFMPETGSTGNPNDDIPFARPRIPDREHRRRDLFVGDRCLA